MFYSRFVPGGNSFCFSLPAPPRQCIDLHFEENYSIESSWECKFDNIEVRDGPFGFSPMLGRYCGQHSPPDIRSSGRYLWIKFVTDGELEAVGFSASYNFTAGTSVTFLPCTWTRLLREPLVVLSVVCLCARLVFPLETRCRWLGTVFCCLFIYFFLTPNFTRELEQCGFLWHFSGLEEAESKPVGVVKHNGCVSKPAVSYPSCFLVDSLSLEWCER